MLPTEFSIDVGGTFTDCLATAPDGTQYRHKLLSSGVVKGQVGAGSSELLLVDNTRKNDPMQFWDEASLAIFSEDGSLIAERQVARFDQATGTMELATPLDQRPTAGTRYELRHDYDAPVLAIRYLLGLSAHETVPPVVLRLGTTRGTNALLTRTGANSALIVTRGFGDVLRIGYQDRPKLFELAIKKRAPLTDSTVEIEERIAANGETLLALNPEQVRKQLADLKQSGVESLAICLLHADLYPQHEILIEQIAREVGFVEISRSSEVSPLVKLVARAETTLVDAYLNPVLRTYFAKLQKELPGSQIRLMTSSGGLTSIESFRGCHSVLSGPAGGVVGYAKAAEKVGYSKAIGFDMGGTSTDVSRYAGKYEEEFESDKAGVRLMTPTLAIETIAAGGGSVCWFDGVKLRVGPQSAGADPGPACYGRGGPLTVTDVNLVLGRILTERFPFQLDGDASLAALVSISQQVQDQTGESLTPEKLAEGFLKIANANMAGAIRNVTVAKGVQPEGHLLVAFGGAAAQHACAVADELRIREILHHPDAGILSAYGISVAEEVRHATRGLWQSLVMLEEADFQNIFAELAETPTQEFAADGIARDRLQLFPSLEVHYTGSDAKLTIPYLTIDTLRAQFEQLHREQFGYLHVDRPLHVASARLEIRLPASTQEPLKLAAAKSDSEPISQRIIHNEREIDVRAYERKQLNAGTLITGPALITQENTVAVVDPTWDAKVLDGGELLLTKCEEDRTEQQFSEPQAVELEIFNNLLVGVAERMGHVLRRTAVSVNVKERLDYSCAVFTGEGKLVANAPHVPVHLGAMGITVRSILADNPELRPGDVYLSNDPYHGGSHLPDITMVLPVHDEATGELLFCTACRAHHAEIGGVQPGSMPPSSTKLAEEGVLISNFLYRRQGRVFEEELRELLTKSPYPSRNANENLADLAAQAAAVERGASELKQIVREHGREKLKQQMQAVQYAAEQKVRQSLSGFAAGKYEFQDYLETAAGQSVPIQVTITILDPKAQHCKDASGAAAVFDFTGTCEVVAGNLNANRAIVTAAVLYTLRLLVDEDMPLNEGVLDAIEIVLPDCLLNPAPCEIPGDSPAVAAGNVETSQRVVDVLLGAFGIAAASQGTMNNVLFGDETFGYYETLGGGSGATGDAPGADAVQVHMTNTRSTDPEILERRLPVRLWEMSIRKNSGGRGQHVGGNGMRRRLEFLKDLKLSLITGRRGPHPPFGLEGGGAGECGRNRLVRAGGSVEELPGICERAVRAGEILEIETPGGGGFGVK